MSANVKVSQSIRDALVAAGVVKGTKLTIELSQLVVEATAVRLKPDAKRDMLAKAIEAGAKGENGVIVLGPKEINQAGLPKTWITAGSLWAGVGEASRLAFDLGYHSEFSQDLDENYSLKIAFTLRPLTNEDRAEMAKKLTAREKKPATEAATPTAPSDAGAAETETAPAAEPSPEASEPSASA